MVISQGSAIHLEQGWAIHFEPPGSVGPLGPAASYMTGFK